MVENAQEQHEVEALGQRGHVVDRELREFDVNAHHLRGEAGLAQIGVISVDAQHPRRTPPLHLDRVEAAVAADIEHSAPAQIGRQRMREAAPFDRRVVAEEMLGGGRHPAEVDVVEPRAQRRRLAADLVAASPVIAAAGRVRHWPLREWGLPAPRLPVSSRIASR